MIGYDATNAVGQGIAAREKIFSFTLSYFMFIYRYIPGLALKIDSSEDQDIATKLAKELEKYFENYILQTENAKKDDRSPLAKYYLASIYYFEPTFDFDATNTPDIYKLGKTYLVELFKENLNQFLSRSQKYFKFSSPSFDENTEGELWRFFAFTMLKSKYAKQYVNIVQQPVSKPSRYTPKNEYMLYINNYLQGTSKDETYKNIFHYPTTHDNKEIKVKLKNVNAVSPDFNLGEYYNSIKFFIKDEFLHYHYKIIDVFDLTSGYEDWFKVYGNAFDNQMTVFLGVINPANNKSSEEQEKAYKIMFNTIAGAAEKAPIKVDALDSYSSSGGKMSGAKKSASGQKSTKNIPNGIIYPKGKGYTAKETFTQEDFYYDGSDVFLRDLMLHFLETLYAYYLLATTKVSDPWDDSPTMIKPFLNQIDNYIDTRNSLGTNIKYDDSLFISYYFNFDDQKLTFPKGESPSEEKVELCAFFEFSFQPNIDRIIQKFNLGEKNFEDFGTTKEEFLKRFNYLKENYILNFSKTECYDFLKIMFKEDLVLGLTIEELTSLFDLHVSLLHKVSKKYIISNKFDYANPLVSSKKTKYSGRRWLPEENKNSRNILFYNFLSDDAKNVAPIGNEKQVIQSFQCDASIFLGSTADYKINNIRTFNPSYMLEDDEIVNKFINDVANTPIGNFLKNNYNYNPFNYPYIAEKLLAVEASSLPQSFINQNLELFIKPYSEFSKNLLDNLITNVDKIT